MVLFLLFDVLLEVSAGICTIKEDRVGNILL